MVEYSVTILFQYKLLLLHNTIQIRFRIPSHCFNCSLVCLTLCRSLFRAVSSAVRRRTALSTELLCTSSVERVNPLGVNPLGVNPLGVNPLGVNDNLFRGRPAAITTSTVTTHLPKNSKYIYQYYC